MTGAAPPSKKRRNSGRRSDAAETARSAALHVGFTISRPESGADRNFLLCASAAGSFGAGIGRTAIPLLAVTALGATPFEVGLLNSAQTAAFVLIGLPAGAIVDRVRRRQTMILMDVLRFGLGAVVLLLWSTGLLGMGALITLVALMGCATVFFDVAAMAYLTQLFGKEELLKGNGKLQGVSSATSVGAPATAGGLVAVIGAAVTSAGVSIGYAVSALLLGRIRHREAPARPLPWGQIWRDTGVGMRYVFGTKAMRAIAMCTVGVNLALAARAAVLVIFLLELGFGPVEIGIATAASGVGGVLAAVNTGTAVMHRVWLTLLWSQAVAVLVPLAAGEYALVLVCAGMAVSSYGATSYNIAQVTFRQLSCPPELLARVGASNRFLVWSTLPVGGLLGGVFGSYLPVAAVLWLTTAAQVASALWLVRFRHAGGEPDDDDAA
jgi:MFS family permease